MVQRYDARLWSAAMLVQIQLPELMSRRVDPEFGLLIRNCAVRFRGEMRAGRSLLGRHVLWEHDQASSILVAPTMTPFRA